MSSESGKVLVIAEAGVNHNGSVERAIEMVDAAREAGADVVKFQTFKAELNITAEAPQANYQQQNTGVKQSQLEMVRPLELGHEAHERIAEHCRQVGIEFLSTPFDLPSVGMLRELGVQRLKISSGELIHGALLYEAARTGLPIILSTGMSELEEIDRALQVLAYAYTHDVPLAESRKEEVFAPISAEARREALAGRLSLLHCSTQYPTPMEAVNLQAMQSLADRFDVPVGYSDHTLGITVPIAATALGACIIEKHFTLDRDLPGPDHRASLEADELRAMVQGIREVEAALGDGQKRVADCEMENKPIARKSLYAACDIEEGALIQAADMIAKRPGTGRNPMEFWDLKGQAAKVSYRADDLL